jgi:hypothetical protein
MYTHSSIAQHAGTVRRINNRAAIAVASILIVSLISAISALIIMT